MADLGAVKGNAVVAGHGDFHAATERGSMNCSDDRLAAILDFQKQGQQPSSARFSRSHFLEFLDVCTRDEGIATSGQNGDLQLVVP